MTVLALTVALASATARPAAAAEASSLWGEVWQWMSGLVWSQLVAGGSGAAAAADQGGLARVTAAEGYEIDPDGVNTMSLSGTRPGPGIEAGGTSSTQNQ